MLKQSLHHSCVLSLSLLPCTLPGIQSQAEDLLHSILPLLTTDVSKQDWVREVTPEVLQHILSYLVSKFIFTFSHLIVLLLLLFIQLETPEAESCLTSKQISEFVIFLQNDFLSNQPYSLVLSPLIHPHSSDISMATLLEPAMSRVSAVTELSGLLLELGYSSTRDREEVLLLLQQFSVSQLTPACLAKVLGSCLLSYLIWN